jgi:protein-L-isoaspartate(D-aspartate) O-methyltransferase
MDFEQARFNMIEQQIRTWEVLDPQVLDLLFEVKREDFVPPGHRELAFADLEVPIGHGEAMMQPKVEARIVQELNVQPHENVYEVGTARLPHGVARASRAARDERRDPSRPEGTRGREPRRPRHRQRVARRGRQRRAPLAESRVRRDRVTGSMPILPQSFLTGCVPGGRLFAVLGDLPVMKAVIVRQPVAGSFQHVELFETLVKPLVNASQPVPIPLLAGALLQ